MSTNSKLCKLVYSAIFFFFLSTAFSQVPVGLPIEIDNTIRDINLSEDGNLLTMIKLQLSPSGHLRELTMTIYEWTGTEWLNLGESPVLFTAPAGSGANYDIVTRFSENGTHIAVYSQYWQDFNALLHSPVHVFKWIGGNNWEVLEGDGLPQATFMSLAADGNKIAIGDPYSKNWNKGMSQVFEWNGETWSQLGQTLDGVNMYDNFGYVSLSNNGSRLTVGSNFHYAPDLEKGYIWTYDWNGTEWNLLNTNGLLSTSAFPFITAEDGDRIRSRPTTGSIVQFAWHGDGWTPEVSTVNDLGRLSFDGNRLINETATVYHWNNHSWAEITPQVLPTASSFNNIHPKISGDGSRFAISLDSAITVYEFNLSGFSYELPKVCVNGGPQTFPSIVSPVGGQLEGPGVSQGSIPGSLTIDPTTAGIGTHTITYSINNETYTTTVDIVAPILATLSFPDTFRLLSTGKVSVAGSGLPQGGRYTNEQGYLDDDGNGFSFTANLLADTINTLVTYTIEDENGCSASVSKLVVMINEAPNGGISYSNQIGADIFGQNPGGLLGFSVSLSDDGKTLATSAPKLGWGAVYVYEYDGENWIKASNDIIGQSLSENYGHDISLSGNANHLIVGIPQQRTPDTYDLHISGGFQIFERDSANSNNWNSEVMEGYSSPGSRLGNAVDISNDASITAIGAPYFNQAWFYNNLDSMWDQFNILFPHESGFQHIFGSDLKLSASGTRLIVGGPGTDIACAFKKTGNSWVLRGQTISQPMPGDRFGYAVDITDDGNRIVIGAPQIDSTNATGYVQVYDWNGATWEQAGADILGNFPGEHFGAALAISADGLRLVIGAPNNGAVGPNSGRAALYEWNGTDWMKIENVIHGGTQAHDEFGFAVDISALGDVIAVGAIQSNALVPCGYVRVFTNNYPSFPNHFNATCINQATQYISGALPIGGTYSGLGVSDNGDGTAFNFNPAEAGLGQATITYTLDTIELTNTIEVVDIPDVSIALPDTIFVMTGAPLTITGNGQPTGGIYSSESSLFEDNGDGLTFNFTGADDFEEAQTISYTYVNEAGCENTISTDFILFDITVGVVDLKDLEIEVFPNPTADILYLRGQDMQTAHLLDQYGRILWQQEGDLSEIDLSDFPAGAYYLLIKLKNGKIGGQHLIKG